MSSFKLLSVIIPLLRSKSILLLQRQEKLYRVLRRSHSCFLQSCSSCFFLSVAFFLVQVSFFKYLFTIFFNELVLLKFKLFFLPCFYLQKPEFFLFFSGQCLFFCFWCWTICTCFCVSCAPVGTVQLGFGGSAHFLHNFFILAAALFVTIISCLRRSTKIETYLIFFSLSLLSYCSQSSGSFAF